MIPEIANRVDARVGDLIENAASRHHIRRLGRLGWDRALRGSANVWAEDPPPRSGNSLEVHIDGLAALPSIAAAVRGARSFVHVAGWTVDPGFAVERDPSVVTVRDLLAEAAQRVDVRVLVWAGAPLPIMQPSRARARELMDRLVRNTRIQGALDPRNRPMHCHHEKLVIVDGTVAFVGGIDLTALAGDRLDGSPHNRSSTLGWHDAAAQLAGPAVADVWSHFAMRWETTTGEHLPRVDAPAEAGHSRVQVIRTVPEGTYKAMPRGDFSILETYIGALRGARASSISRINSSGVGRWLRSSARSCWSHRVTIFVSASFSRGIPTTATTTRGDSSDSCRLPITVIASWLGQLGPPAVSDRRCMCMRRSGSSTIPG